MKSNNTIAVVGAGISGLAVAIALRKIGTHVEVFEQAGAFKRVGAAINMTPNAVKVLDGLGLGKSIRSTAHIPLTELAACGIQDWKHLGWNWVTRRKRNMALQLY